MGPENKIDPTSYTLYWDDTPIKPGLLPEITVDADAPEPENLLTHMPEITMYIKTPKRWRCRSRKRFIKLMMSEGISRNGAVWLADFIRELMPYGEAWRQYALFNTWIITVGG